MTRITKRQVVEANIESIIAMRKSFNYCNDSNDDVRIRLDREADGAARRANDLRTAYARQQGRREWEIRRDTLAEADRIIGMSLE